MIMGDAKPYPAQGDYDSCESLSSGSLESPFTEEIDHREIELFEVVGKGTFGLVRKGRWRGQDVAVKSIESDHEKRAFLVEVRQLSRVDHPNIVKLYGARVRHPVCLVMEYAEGGSLYNVLHTMKEVHYTAAHAISWMLQCAKGVAYLHNMKPKALVHRDLKPPNLLLVNGGTVLKICDFGTACDVQTQMTNNKGSAAWMAPEVFESSNYTEKCDVFSWGIILWEVLTRRKPFEDCGPPAFCIMWAVHQGKRPPMVKGCPLCLEKLMTSCWSKEPSLRPPMAQVERIMADLSQYFEGADQPISYPVPPEAESGDTGSSSAGLQYALSPTSSSWGSQRQATSLAARIPESTPQRPEAVPQVSAPASLSCSVEDLSQPSEGALENGCPPNTRPKRTSADFALLSRNPKGHHRRTGSMGSAQQAVAASPPADPPQAHGGGGDEGAAQRPKCWQQRATPPKGPEGPRKTSWPSTPECPQEVDLGLNAHLLIEPALQPLSPAPSCRESMQIFDDHRRLAQWHFKLQTEICLLKQRSKELDKELVLPEPETLITFYDEMEQLEKEKDALRMLRESLKGQLQRLKSRQQSHQRGPGSDSQGSDDWVFVPSPR